MPKLMRVLASTVAALGCAALVQAPAHADGRLDEGRFVVVTKNLHDFTKPFGDRTTDGQMVRFGYRACAALDRNRASTAGATRDLYNDERAFPLWERQQLVFYAAQYLCVRHLDRYKTYP
ncbi:DUF732 domain-containing protein [Tsukamurella tyrosinosolvens]|uniref:DUF732 domain-containing protein n=1 Tax=Tsukamurella tyrosinosolvens TaxID=57704 RepID=A0A1H4ZVC0_TSUTY|nr:DUF732 domain-containing protein [Tsukamurella tyrosinosolvens]AUN41994.1 hypothetical protein ASU32_19940 [Tsukamurella tyrosinosolvens]KXO95513.1 hypothetical protein AXK58_12500 [Tsukamurella tyrosinosolvens]KXP07262.1 hypothetical protein AXK59_04030 [Tsukamurella tyrosinosolvens]KZL98463.1 hypothetical protein AXX05_06180 [Tsukamurella tyrosinosolvens]MCA4994651.1 DUF732 domain-containing protein [Tsukamurella tyrosinosolvens]